MLNLALQTPNFQALLFAGMVVMTAGLLLTIHGWAAYALLVWEWTAALATWVYVDPVIGIFFFLAGAVQFPIAAHIWGDPLRETLREMLSGPGL